MVILNILDDILSSRAVFCMLKYGSPYLFYFVLFCYSILYIFDKEYYLFDKSYSTKTWLIDTYNYILFSIVFYFYLFKLGLDIMDFTVIFFVIVSGILYNTKIFNIFKNEVYSEDCSNFFWLSLRLFFLKIFIYIIEFFYSIVIFFYDTTISIVHNIAIIYTIYLGFISYKPSLPPLINNLEIFYREYITIFIYLIICFLLSAILMLVSYICTVKNTSLEKLSSYECGFDSFDDSRKTFDAHFYIVGVLFLIFDLEIAFLIPWAIHLSTLNFFSFFISIVFIVLITIGFAYEWSRGVLNWSEDNVD